MFEHKVQLRWSDYDALRHVNNVVFLEFMQDARVAFMESMGVGRDTLTDVGHVVARNEIDYLKPVEMEKRQLTVRLWVEGIGGASYKVGYEFVDAEGTLYAKARTVMVTIDVASGAVVRVPASLRELMAR